MCVIVVWVVNFSLEFVCRLFWVYLCNCLIVVIVFRLFNVFVVVVLMGVLFFVRICNRVFWVVGLVICFKVFMVVIVISFDWWFCVGVIVIVSLVIFVVILCDGSELRSWMVVNVVGCFLMVFD